jgi:hypothetical protein
MPPWKQGILWTEAGMAGRIPSAGAEKLITRVNPSGVEEWALKKR